MEGESVWKCGSVEVWKCGSVEGLSRLLATLGSWFKGMGMLCCVGCV